jgi:hypothetical protein
MIYLLICNRTQHQTPSLKTSLSQLNPLHDLKIYSATKILCVHHVCIWEIPLFHCEDTKLCLMFLHSCSQEFSLKVERWWRQLWDQSAESLTCANNTPSCSHLINQPVIHSFINGSTALCWAQVVFSFVVLYTVCRTPWTGDQPVARSLPTHRIPHKHRINAHRHPFLEWDSNPLSHCSSERRQFMP